MPSVGSVMTDGMRCQSPPLSSGVKRLRVQVGASDMTSRSNFAEANVTPARGRAPDGAIPVRARRETPRVFLPRRSHAIPPSPEGDGPLANFLWLLRKRRSRRRTRVAPQTARRCRSRRPQPRASTEAQRADRSQGRRPKPIGRPKSLTSKSLRRTERSQDARTRARNGRLELGVTREAAGLESRRRVTSPAPPWREDPFATFAQAARGLERALRP